MHDHHQGWQETLLWWLLYVVSWVGSSALALWLTLQLRINLIDLNNFLGWGPWILIGIDKFGILLLGLGWLISVFVIEMYLRNSPTLVRLGRRSGYLFLWVGGGLALSFALQWLLV
jgi:hypothetical protein